jgi:alpha-tubulin suppressor-like RCC1 family protein
MGDQPLTTNFFFQYANSTPLAGAQVTSSTVAGLGLSLSCANDSTAQVLYCWGGNGLGQLGNPEAGAFAYGPMAAPVQVQLDPGYGLSGRFKEITAGMGFACALEDTGNMYCWGTAGSGQLGPTIAPSSSAASAIAIDVMDSVSHIAASFGTVCAVDSLQHVQCWGGNEAGELGHDPSLDTPNCANGPCNANPSAITTDGTMTGKPFGPAVGLSVGLGFACSLKSDGTVWCWGNAAGGRLGNGAEGPLEAGANDAGMSFAPTQVIGLP